MRALAVELVGIYREARSLEDEEYAADAIDDLLDAVGDDTDDEVLVALLDLPGTELTAPLVDDAVCMLADTGALVVEHLLQLVLARTEPVAPRAFQAFDRMDDDELADGLFEVLAGQGEDDLRQLAAELLAALGHAGARRLQDAFEDPWMHDLAQIAVDAQAGCLAGVAVPAPTDVSDEDAGEGSDDTMEGDRDPGPSTAGEDGADAEPFDGAPASTDESDPLEVASARYRPPASPGPARDALEAEYRAFLERFERESGG